LFELYFLLIHIPRRIRALARERKQSAWPWSLMAIGAWVGCEIVVFLIAGALIVTNEELEKSGLFMFATYVLAIGSAALSASLVISQLRKMPVPRGDEAPWQ
jgi:hypothetical protein